MVHQLNLDAFQRNPFQYIGSLTDLDNAISRSREIREVLTHVARNEYVSVLAPRQTGKTTFLRSLNRLIPESLYIDLERKSYTDMRQVTQDFIEAVEAATGKSYTVSENSNGLFWRFLNESSTAGGNIFLVDELGASTAIAWEFLSHIRAFHAHGPDISDAHTHRFVIAGSVDLADLTLGEDSSTSPYNIAHEVYIGDFAEWEIRDYIHRMAPGRFSEQAVTKVYAYTRGHPFLVQFLCFKLYEQDAAGVEKELENLSMLLNDLRVEDTVNVHSMVYHVWDHPDRPKDAVAFLSEILGGVRYKFAVSSSVVRFLYLQGCIRNDQGFCTIRNPIYEEVLQKNLEIRRKLELSSVSAQPAKQRPSYEPYFRRLVNFDGFARILMKEEVGSKLNVPIDGVFLLKARRPYMLEVEVVQGPQAPGGLGSYEPLRVENGEETGRGVAIRVQVDSFYEFGTDTDITRHFSQSQREACQSYPFLITPHDPTPEPVQVFINFYQDVSLIHVIRLQVRVEE